MSCALGVSRSVVWRVPYSPAVFHLFHVCLGVFLFISPWMCWSMDSWTGQEAEDEYGCAQEYILYPDDQWGELWRCVGVALGGVVVTLISETIDWPVMLYGCRPRTMWMPLRSSSSWTWRRCRKEKSFMSWWAAVWRWGFLWEEGRGKWDKVIRKREGSQAGSQG